MSNSNYIMTKKELEQRRMIAALMYEFNTTTNRPTEAYNLAEQCYNVGHVYARFQDFDAQNSEEAVTLYVLTGANGQTSLLRGFKPKTAEAHREFFTTFDEWRRTYRLESSTSSSARAEDKEDTLSELEVRTLIADYCRDVTLGQADWDVTFALWVQICGHAKVDRSRGIVLRRTSAASTGTSTANDE